MKALRVCDYFERLLQDVSERLKAIALQGYVPIAPPVASAILPHVEESFEVP